MNEEIISEQKKLCEKYGVEWVASPMDLKLGISKDIDSGVMPINGLRHPAENGTVGWYIWCGGDIDNNPDFWDALHVYHLEQRLPQVLKYLGLPPGWRFQIDDKGYEDVWYDENLINA